MQVCSVPTTAQARTQSRQEHAAGWGASFLGMKSDLSDVGEEQRDLLQPTLAVNSSSGVRHCCSMFTRVPCRRAVDPGSDQRSRITVPCTTEREEARLDDYMLRRNKLRIGVIRELVERGHVVGNCRKDLSSRPVRSRGE